MGWLDEARARCEAATEGPWRAANGGVRTVAENTPDRVKKDGEPYKNAKYGPDWPALCYLNSMLGNQRWSDWDFIAHARADLPRALALIQRMAGVLREVRHGPRDQPGWAHRRLKKIDAVLKEVDDA